MSEGEREQRRARLHALREAGVAPYPAQTGAHTEIAEVRAAHDAKDAAQLDAEANEVAIVGRVRAHRSFGKLLFFTLEQNGARLQVSAQKGELEPALFRFARELQVADFVRVTGRVWRTKKGELTVALAAAELLAVALRPLPAKWHGLRATEARYRQRYLDLLANPRAREVALLRSATLRALRQFLDARRYLEVETPVLQPLYGGAAAKPFTTRHEGYEQTLFLRISDELYLKRLLVGGLDRVYEIAHNFRNEGVSHKHSPEFCMLECYAAYADYEDMMQLAQEMLRDVAKAVLGSSALNFAGHALDFAAPFRRVTLHDALREATGVDILAAPALPELRAAARANGVRSVEDSSATSWAALVDELFSREVEPKLLAPTFVTHHPAELSPLAKRSAADPRLAERFELFVGGMELANAFSELNDPIEQRAHFEEQRARQAAGDAEAHPMDEEFLTALEHGMPPAGGLGIGVDRLVRVLADAPNLREVILFPHLRPEDDA